MGGLFVFTLSFIVHLYREAVLVSGGSIDARFVSEKALEGFKCEYPGYENCNSKDDRGCWVKKDGKTYDVDTDYESEFPIGTMRTFNLEITEKVISPDGFEKIAQVVNGQFPGPLIEACWGDTIIVNVKNTIKNNGTTVHFHGLRMFGENSYDGTNAITQCPIAQGDSFTHKFQLRQYGHSWYHSHYSSQYGEGTFGPVVIHGPSTANWDEEFAPIMVHEWHHANAYEAFTESLTASSPPKADLLTLNGVGRNHELGTGSYFEQTFEKDKKHLLRIVNSAIDFHFHFSIDNHVLQVVSVDYVPIEPFWTNSLSVGIGQRYSFIVHANQTSSANGRYWMRTEYFDGSRGDSNYCQFPKENFPPDQTDRLRVGIINYSEAKSGDPKTSRWPVTVGCKDTISTPRVKWKITPPQNDVLKHAHHVGLDRNTQHHDAFRWTLGEQPQWLDYGNPTLLNLENKTWDAEYVVKSHSFNDSEGFAYIVINSGGGAKNLRGGTHPIHLHGHDFAILSQGDGEFNLDNPIYNMDNPPRRDTAMLGANGHLVLAYKTDNPGAWLLHCHIAWHTGSGMSLQVVERQESILNWIGEAALDSVKKGCKNWAAHVEKHKDDPNVFDPDIQDDSGV